MWNACLAARNRQHRPRRRIPTGATDRPSLSPQSLQKPSCGPVEGLAVATGLLGSSSGQTQRSPTPAVPTLSQGSPRARERTPTWKGRSYLESTVLWDAQSYGASLHFLKCWSHTRCAFCTGHEALWGRWEVKRGRENAGIPWCGSLVVTCATLVW